MNSVLMKAILAMESYNRGYNAGINFGNNPTYSEATPSITKLGNATVVQSTRNDDTAAQAAGFYAIAYNYNGEKVISYRGTDQKPSLLNPLTPDVANGWTIGGGDYRAPQAKMAFAFYNSVGGGDPRTANICLTGHSLGGGLVH